MIAVGMRRLIFFYPTYMMFTAEEAESVDGLEQGEKNHRDTDYT